MTVDIATGTAHSRCMEAGEHICSEPSGRRCAEQPCDKPAGTGWGPYWCPEHDKERLDRVSAGFESIRAEFAKRASQDVGTE